jgi:AraC family ethanolamine operon transcriptional activator
MSVGQQQAGPAIVVGEITAADPCIYEEISSPWEILATPIGTGTFGYRKSYLVTPALILYQETFASAVRVQGLTPAGMFGFSVPVRLGARSAFWGKPFTESGLPASMPGGLDAVVDARQTHLIGLFSLDFVRRTLPEQCVLYLERAASRRLLPMPPGGTNRLGRWMLGVLDAALHRPEVLRHAAAVCSLEQDLLQHLVEACRLASAASPQPDTPLRRRGLDRALEFLRSADPASVTVPELCRIAGVSQRTLEYAFRESFQLTPSGFLRLQRFHAARRALAAACSSNAAVAGIAHQLGFFELGRFAAQYKRLFGELPSQTLARTPG